MMEKIEFIILQGPNLEPCTIGLFDLDFIPRIGEFVCYGNEIDDDLVLCRVMDICHNIKPKSPVVIHIMSIDDAKYHT
jgi:hypothetical protein